MVFPKAVKAQQVEYKYIEIVAWVYVALLVIMIVGQLVAFEGFLPLISADYFAGQPYGEAALIGGLIVLTEVFAIPYLLRMTLSPLMRWFSLICSLFASAIWAKLVLLSVLGKEYVFNYGLFGSKVPLHSSAVAVVFSLILLVLAVISAWGLWPIRKK